MRPKILCHWKALAQRREALWAYECSEDPETKQAVRVYLISSGRWELIRIDCNVGFFVQDDDEYEWLCSLLTIPKIKQLLGPEYNGKEIDRL